MEREDSAAIFIGDWPRLAEIEERYILRVLSFCDWNKTEAAERLGIDRRTIYRRILKMKKSGKYKVEFEGIETTAKAGTGVRNGP
jgi:transcriptional regulator of acetoin/glycerol metabolism